jgi:hypothetical protein
VTEEEHLRARIAELEERSRALTRSLEERSRLLRRLSAELCSRDLLILSSMGCGHPVPRKMGIGFVGWHETTRLTNTDVDRAMAELWRSSAPEPIDEP